MYLEAARLKIKTDQQEAFEAAFRLARPLIEQTPGFQKIEVRRCVEETHLYLLLVWWESVEAHEINFRQSSRYLEWQAHLHHFYDPFPVVEHFEPSFL